MVERVWYKPPEGKLVPRAPGQMAREYFPPEGDWTARTQFIERQLARGDGTLVDGGDEAGLAAGNARREQERAEREAAAEAEHRRINELPTEGEGGTVANAGAAAAAVKPARLAPEERMAAAKERLGYTAPNKRDATQAKPDAAGDSATSERK